MTRSRKLKIRLCQELCHLRQDLLSCHTFQLHSHLLCIFVCHLCVVCVSFVCGLCVFCVSFVCLFFLYHKVPSNRVTEKTCARQHRSNMRKLPLLADSAASIAGNDLRSTHLNHQHQSALVSGPLSQCLSLSLSCCI